MRLVFLEQIISERSARRVEHHRHALGRLFLHEFVQHVEYAEDGAGGHALRIGERRQRMERSVQIRGTIDQQQLTRTHGVNVLLGLQLLLGLGLRLRLRRGTGRLRCAARCAAR